MSEDERDYNDEVLGLTDRIEPDELGTVPDSVYREAVIENARILLAEEPLLEGDNG